MQNNSPFDAIRQVDEVGNERWSGRELAKILGYTRFDKFKNSIEKAKIACISSGHRVEDHMPQVGHMIGTGKGAKRKAEDVLLSRYGAYLTVMNADSSKPIVALAQTYFAEQTRRQELNDQWNALPENQKRLALRGEINSHNINLSQTARRAGVETPQDFADFHDHGYKGLYGGMNAADIAEHKKLADNQQILDYMGSDELAANIFRASQTKQKLEREKTNGKDLANQAHYGVGQKIRQTIQELGGTMPEELATPDNSIQQLQKQETKRLKRGAQTSMFEEER